MPRDSRLTDQVLALQRAFAGHALRLRGSLTNADDDAPNVRQVELIGHNAGRVEAGQAVQLRSRVVTPPVAAYFNAIPLGVGATYHAGPPEEYTVFLEIPRGTRPATGRITVRWSLREIPAEPPLRLVAGPVYNSFNLLQQQARFGETIDIARFSSEPLEVEFGDTPATRFSWDGDLLRAEVPVNAWRARVRVATADRNHHRSNQDFNLFP